MNCLNLKKSLLATVIVALFSIVGCGGGDASQAISNADKATLNENSTSELATSLSQIGISFGDVGDGIAPNGTEINLIQRRAEAPYSATKNKMKTTEEGTETCTQGGTVEYSTTETSATFTLHDCKENGITYNGSVSASVNSDQTAMTVKTNGFSVIAENGDKVLIDSLSATVGFSNDEFSKLTVAVSGSITTQVDSVEFVIRKIEITENSFYFDGDIKTDCLGGWITITTPTKFEFTISGDIVAGKLVISGQDSATITIEIINEGETVRLTDPIGNTTDYNSLEELIEAQDNLGSCSI